MEQKATRINPGVFWLNGTDRHTPTEDTSLRYKDYRKRWNEYAKNHVVSEFPIHLDIEAVSVCNYRCIMCPWHSEAEELQSFTLRNKPKSDSGLGYMDWGLFREIIDEASLYKPTFSSVKFNYRGETLLAKKLPEMIRYAKDKGVIDIQFNTNGSILDDKLSRRLIDSGLDMIIFSVDGATKETYEKIRKLGKYDNVYGNINRFIELRNNMGLKKPRTRVQMCRQEENDGEVKSFIGNWRDKVNVIGFGLKKDPNVIDEEIERFPCPQIWQRLMICYDGEIRPCCGDWNGEMKLGDATKQSLYDIWHSDKLNEIRQKHLEGRFRELDVCWGCNVNTVRRDAEVEEAIQEYSAIK